MAGIIVIEGADCMGKTTLINTCLATWAKGGRRLHCTKKSTAEKQLKHLWRMFLVALKYVAEGKYVFIDRWWPSHLVYSSIYGDEQIPISQIQMMHDLFVSLRIGKYFVLVDEPERAEKRFQAEKEERGEMYAGNPAAKVYWDFAKWGRIGPLDSKNAQVVDCFSVFPVASRPNARTVGYYGDHVTPVATATQEVIHWNMQVAIGAHAVENVRKFLHPHLALVKAARKTH